MRVSFFGFIWVHPSFYGRRRKETEKGTENGERGEKGEEGGGGHCMYLMTRIYG